jgi:hypothetical protein
VPICLFFLDFAIYLLLIVRRNMSNNPTPHANHVFVTFEIEIDPWRRSRPEGAPVVTLRAPRLELPTFRLAGRRVEMRLNQIYDVRGPPHLFERLEPLKPATARPDSTFAGRFSARTRPSRINL